MSNILGPSIQPLARPAVPLLLPAALPTIVPTCELCRRRIEGVRDPTAIQTHHLRPEERATSPTATLCRPCHDQVHALFTNEELRESFDTVDALRGADRLQDYLDWIRTTDKLHVDTRTSDRVREQR